MTTQDQLDKLANEYNKTKDPKYKEVWNKLIKEVAYGFNTTNGRTVSSSKSNKRDDRGNRTVK